MNQGIEKWAIEKAIEYIKTPTTLDEFTEQDNIKWIWIITMRNKNPAITYKEIKKISKKEEQILLSKTMEKINRIPGCWRNKGTYGQWTPFPCTNDYCEEHGILYERGKPTPHSYNRKYAEDRKRILKEIELERNPIEREDYDTPYWRTCQDLREDRGGHMEKEKKEKRLTDPTTQPPQKRCYKEILENEKSTHARTNRRMAETER